MDILRQVEEYDAFGEWIKKHYPYLHHRLGYSIHDLRGFAKDIEYPYKIRHQFDEVYTSFDDAQEDLIRSLHVLKAWIFINKERIESEHLWNKM